MTRGRDSAPGPRDSLTLGPMRTGEPMRFAIKTRPEHTTWARIRDVWQAADEFSLFESAWNWDHFYPLTGDLTGPNPEPCAILAAPGQGRGRTRTRRTAARWAQQWNAITSDPQEWLGLAGTLRSHCAALGRDPGEITCSVNIRIDDGAAVGKVAELAAGYRDAGADLAIMNLPLAADPGMLAPLADALSPLAG